MPFPAEGEKEKVAIKIRPKKLNGPPSKVLQILSSDPPVEEDKYIATKDLKPLDNPGKQIKVIFKDLISADWQKQIDSWNSLRSMAIFHKEILTNDSYIFQNFIQGIIKQVESLRSTVSKNALLGIKDLFDNLKRQLDSDLDYIIPACMKKASDTNIFLSKAAEEALISIWKNSNEVKIVNAITSLSNSRAPSTKVKIQIWLEVLIRRLGEKLLTFKESPTIMAYLTAYIADASEKVRDKAKELLNILKQSMTQKSLDKLIRTTCNEQQEKRISGFYNGVERSAISEAATSRIQFTRNKSTINRRNIMSSSRQISNITVNDQNNSYTSYEISDKPRQNKRVSSVLKNNFGMLRI